jgi:hypothetical protein
MLRRRQHRWGIRALRENCKGKEVVLVVFDAGEVGRGGKLTGEDVGSS